MSVTYFSGIVYKVENVGPPLLWLGNPNIGASSFIFRISFFFFEWSNFIMKVVPYRFLKYKKKKNVITQNAISVHTCAKLSAL